MNVHNKFTTTYHPQTNRQVERFNRTIVSAIRAYIGEHPRDWDLYTNAITYAYNCQPQESTAIAPFDLVLSNPPGPLALEAQPSQPTSAKDFKSKWKAWLEKALTETRDPLSKAQERYKRNYDRRLRRDLENIKAGDFVFLRVERKDDKETRHKLAPIADGPYLVKDVNQDAKTVVIVYDDQTVENVSRSRVVLAPRRLTPTEQVDETRPMTINEIISDYPTSEVVNNRHIAANPVSEPRTSNEEPPHLNQEV